MFSYEEKPINNNHSPFYYSGKRQGDRLVADCSFQSEGQVSRLLAAVGGLWEGYGDVCE